MAAPDLNKLGCSPPALEPGDAEALREELKRLLTAKSFGRSERQARFLTHILECWLAGEGARLNEYSLAAEVFGRSADFRPDTDPIVRAEASRLRKSLQAYYQAEGRESPVMIDLPPRTYVPVVQVKRAEPEPTVIEMPSHPVNRRSVRAMAVAALLVAVLGAVAIWFGRSIAAPKAEVPTVVVLPFSDVSAGHSHGAFCDALTGEVTSAMTAIPGLQVVSRVSASRYRGAHEDIRRIGRELNASMALVGTVSDAGGRLRIDVDLVDTAQGVNVWSDWFETQQNDLVAVQQAIGRGLAAAMRPVSGSTHSKAGHGYRPNDAAYLEYVRGIQLTRHPAWESMLAAIQHLQRATELDPDFAPALGSLALYTALYGEEAGLSPAHVKQSALASAENALKLDPQQAQAYSARGLVRGRYEWNWEAASQDFVKAHQLDPGDARMHEAYVWGYLAPLGHFADAVSQMAHAHELDPISQYVHLVAGTMLAWSGDLAGAEAELRQSQELESSSCACVPQLALVLARQGRLKEALAAVSHRGDDDSVRVVSAAGTIHALNGNLPAAGEAVTRLERFARSRYVSPVHMARIHLSAGNRSAALDAIARAAQERSAEAVYVAREPGFEVLHGETVLQDIMKAVEHHPKRPLLKAAKGTAAHLAVLP